MTVFKLVVEGRPIPKGSLRRGAGRSLYFPARVREWEEKIRHAAANEMRWSGFPKFLGRVRVSCRFYRAPTKTGRLQADLDKLVRCVLDALTGPVFDDDEQVTSLVASKQSPPKGEVERVEITVAMGETPTEWDREESSDDL